MSDEGPSLVTDPVRPGNAGARAVAGGHFAEEACLDCGTALIGPHCHRCGQQAHTPVTLPALFRDSMRRWLAPANGTFLASVRALVVSPGELTRRYVAGQRTRFASPLALFLFGFVLLFAAISLTDGDTRTLGSGYPALSLGRAENDLRAEVDKAERSAPDRAAQGGDPATERERLVTIERGRSALFFLDQARTAWDPQNDPLDVEAQMRRQTRSDLRRQLTDPALFFSRVGSTGYKFSWVLIVVLTPFVWLLFVHRRRQFSLFHHASFVTYSLAFASLLATAMALLSATGVGATLTISLFLIGWLFHAALQLRGAYGVGLTGAAWRAGVLAVCAAIALALIVSGAIALAIA
ncbi:DUF3667 domain-containing protein [Erythrobacter sp. 3-20A1M]|uniref:DUF3667 domain-containing protein n=1 Tax=Erythrobacter sp. 3-20A1M TaxID=2653850 RepID=UPI001BFC9A3C|nr:DUF3667 domain-containing protein [Erythrobacter sp. 3-20A1M]